MKSKLLQHSLSAAVVVVGLFMLIAFRIDAQAIPWCDVPFIGDTILTQSCNVPPGLTGIDGGTLTIANGVTVDFNEVGATTDFVFNPGKSIITQGTGRFLINNGSGHQARKGYICLEDKDDDGCYLSNIVEGTPGGACPAGFVRVESLTAGVAGDCNDNGANQCSLLTEICTDSIDNNCDGNINEGCFDPLTVTGTVNPNPAETGQVITFTAIPADGNPSFPYTYSWSGCSSSTNTCTKNYSTDGVKSDASVTVGRGAENELYTFNVTVNHPTPTVFVTADDSTVAYNDSTIIRWNSTNTTGCAITPNGWTGIAGDQSTGNLTTSTTYVAHCTSPGGPVSDSITITVGAPPIPTLTFSASDNKIVDGESPTLTWDSTDTTSCTASDAWSGNKNISGSQAVSPSGISTFTLTCNGPGGSVSESVTVQVFPALEITGTATPNPAFVGEVVTFSTSVSGGDPDEAISYSWFGCTSNSNTCTKSYTTAGNKSDVRVTTTRGTTTDSFTFNVRINYRTPTVSIWADSTSISYSGSTNIHWDSTDTTSCRVTPPNWSGASGNRSTGSLISSQTYSINCTGPGGSATDSITITVAPPPAPSLSFSANPTTIGEGESTTLTWSGSNVTSCTASDAWSGGRSITGSQNVSPANTSTYALVCTGPGGTTNKSVTVVVDVPQPGEVLEALNGNGQIIGMAIENNKLYLLLLGGNVDNLRLERIDIPSRTLEMRGTYWDASKFRPTGISVKSGSVYIGGTGFGRTVIQKRRASDFALEWESIGDYYLGSSSRFDHMEDLHVSGSSIYIAGAYQTLSSIYSSKSRVGAYRYNLSNGSLVNEFFSATTPTCNFSTVGRGTSIQVFGSRVYVSGILCDGDPGELFVLNASDLSLIKRTESVFVSNGAINEWHTDGMFVDSSGVYMTIGGGSDHRGGEPNIGKYSLSGDPIFEIRASSFHPRAVKGVGNILYLAGKDQSRLKWRVEARSKTDGSLIWHQDSEVLGNNFNEPWVYALEVHNNEIIVGGRETIWPYTYRVEFRKQK